MQQLYTTVDLLFAGNVLGPVSLAALGVGVLLLTCLIGLFSGIAVGANVKVAVLRGGGATPEEVSCAFSTLVVFALATGAALAVVGVLLADWFVAVMETPPESMAEAVSYARLACASTVPVALFNTCAGALRGVGDSRSPLIAQLVGGVLNVALDFLALCVLCLGIEGCALATFLSNGIAAVLALVACARGGWLDARPRERRGGHGRHGESARALRFDASFARSVVAFGIPVGLQALAVTVSNLAIQQQIDLLGYEAAAAFIAYYKVELPVYYSILAIGQATSTFVAQNHGAGRHERCTRGVWVCQIMAIVAAMATSAVIMACATWAFGLFTSDYAVSSLGGDIVACTFPFYFLYAILEVQGDAMRGFGHSALPAAVSFATLCVLRVGLVWVLCAPGPTLHAVAVTYPITWAVCAVSMCVARAVASRSHRKKVDASG